MTKPSIVILATGGTIAGMIDGTNNAIDTGYTAGVLSIDNLINALPQIKDLAYIRWEQIVNIDSSNMSDEIWLKLARAIDRIFASGANGIVITHGTDTLEESAYFLNLVVKSDKPVVLVGAMRASNAISADGAKNLYNAIALASHQNARGKGVMVVSNDRIHSARGVVKTHSLNVDAFSSPDFGDMGYIIDGRVVFYYHIAKKHTESTPFDVKGLKELPKVDILYTYANDRSGIAARALAQNGTKGFVIAGSGAGNIHENQKIVLKELLKKGLKVVISSRVLSGLVALSENDKADGFISSEDLNPQKARILLMLALTKTHHHQTIQTYFEEY